MTKSRKANQIILVERLEKVESKFRALETKLRDVNNPGNKANKTMGILLNSIRSFELVATRYRINRKRLFNISIESTGWWKSHPKAKSRKADPNEDYVSSAIQVDMESLFMYGLILIHRSLNLVKLFLPDNPDSSKFTKLRNFYNWIRSDNSLSPLAKEFGRVFHPTIKWLYGVLRFYRNEFVEHMDKDYQQGMNFAVYGSSFNLSCYKWDITDKDLRSIMDLQNKLEKRKISISIDDDPRQYIQKVFYNIVDIPEDLLDEALTIIEEVGCDSPQPEKLISMVQTYLNTLFDFMGNNFEKSNFYNYVKDQTVVLAKDNVGREPKEPNS